MLQYQLLNTRIKMRYIMKGGVWKNSEDEILKAAIMKYGLNQWSRISSLLQRKSAKQCKQRWYEWLDPSIKKTEWTRTEDEKLLQLARVFPSQWRTIAPFVGRTPTQCYDRYEKLLDIAQGKNPNDPNDLRKLRPGQIDPNPETKPARPDPIDMDEDEKEMLAEVRVRLANTKGKKAKRKEREKIIDEARRLAQLQKARELKMAGVENIITQQELKRLKQKKDIDYNKEVPFKREVPDFVYKTEQSETPASSAFALNITLQAKQGRKREVDQQIRQKIDKRRLKKFRQKDISAAIMQKRQLAKPPPVPISLPTPQLADKDLEQLKKLNITTPLNTHLMQQTPAMTPQNKILFSAGVNLSLNYKQMTGNNQDDADDVLERLKYLRTMQQAQKHHEFQPQNFKPISERIKTPVANQWQKDDKGKLQRLLKGLRKAENVIEFEIPEEEEEEQREEVMDAEEYQRIEEGKQQQQEEERKRTRSEVLKKNLPRVSHIPEKVYYYLRNPVLELIEKEYVSLIYSDAVDYPQEGMEFPEREIPYREKIEEGLLDEARAMVRAESQSIQPYDASKRQELIKRVQLIPETKTVKVQKHSPLQDLKVQYQANVAHYQSQIKKANLAEKKCTVSLAGFDNIIKQKTKEVNSLFDQLQELEIQHSSLQALRAQQNAAISARMEEAQNFYKLIYGSL